jgi:hypothetical protein
MRDEILNLFISCVLSAEKVILPTNQAAAVSLMASELPREPLDRPLGSFAEYFS